MAVAFSSSNTTSTVTDNSRTDSRAGTIGDLSSNNKVTTGDYYEQGLVGQNLQTVINAIRDSSTTNFDSTIGAIQSNAQKAIEATGQAYAESKSELRNALDGLKPIALYAALGMALFYALKRK